MTTDARRIKRTQKNKASQSGQSIVEFAFFLPIFIGLIYYLMQINMVINSGVVFQQYTRARLLEMLRGSADYPPLITTNVAGRQQGWQRFWIGMDRDPWGAGDIDEREEGSVPVPHEVKVGNKTAPGTDDGNDFPPKDRQNVRVRVISFICMPPKLYPAPAGGAAQGPQYMTETINEFVSNSYAGGFGAHIQFCQDN